MSQPRRGPSDAEKELLELMSKGGGFEELKSQIPVGGGFKISSMGGGQKMSLQGIKLGKGKPGMSARDIMNMLGKRESDHSVDNQR